jgi:hypothetical protein
MAEKNHFAVQIDYYSYLQYQVKYQTPRMHFANHLLLLGRCMRFVHVWEKARRGNSQLLAECILGAGQKEIKCERPSFSLLSSLEVGCLGEV